jgi:transcriptional regulator with XRE-family HTH domain
MNLAKSLKKALLERNKSQLDLAKDLGISTVHLNRLANNKAQMSPAIMERIASQFGMKVSEFVKLGED